VEDAVDPGLADPHEALEQPQAEGEGAPSSYDGPPPTDPMLEALLWLCRHHGVDATPVSLLNGLQLNGPLPAMQALQLRPQAASNAMLATLTLAEDELRKWIV